MGIRHDLQFLADEIGKVDLFLSHLASRDTGQYQHIVNQLPHALRALADAGEGVHSGGIQAAGVIFLHGAREAVNRSERRAQIVRDGIGEGLQFLDRRGHAGPGRLHLHGHVVEAPSQFAELVLPAQAHPMLEVAAGDAVRGALQPFDRSEHQSAKDNEVSKQDREHGHDQEE